MFTWTFNNLTGLFPRLSSTPAALSTPKNTAAHTKPDGRLGIRACTESASRRPPRASA